MRINYSKIILQRPNKCLTVAAPDGRERGNAYCVREKAQFHDLSRQN